MWADTSDMGGGGAGWGGGVGGRGMECFSFLFGFVI